MTHNNRRIMPGTDYVSVITSLYADRRSMLYGALGSALAAGIGGIKTQSPILYGLAAAFIVVGLARYWDMLAFARTPLAPRDVKTARQWEHRATIGGAVIALLSGFWCFTGLYIVADDFIALSSVGVSISVLIGVAARNYAVLRLVIVQTIFILAPLAAGLLLAGDIYHALLAVLLPLYFIAIVAIARNIRENLLKALHRRAEASRLAAELDTALTTMPQGLGLLDTAGNVAVVNRGFARLFPGGKSATRTGTHFSTVIASAHQAGLFDAETAGQLTAIIKTGHGETEFGLQGNRRCSVRVHTRRGHTVVMFEDITERVRASQRISYLARHDGLTGLPNRFAFSEHVNKTLAAKTHQHKKNGAVLLMIVDVDDFKHINDTFGHLVGDQLLIEIARRLRSLFGEASQIARFGGDEFVIFRSGSHTRQKAQRSAMAVLAALRRPFRIGAHTHTINASAGIVLEPDDTVDLETLLMRADLALYGAKGEGKNRYRLFEPELDAAYRHRQRLKNDLAQALAKKQLTLVYQPIIDLGTRHISGCEALVRWNHPELGFVPPDVFVPIAEETGLISDLSRFVLQTATRECRNWPASMFVAVNISARDFRNSDVPDMVAKALKHSGLDAHRLEVEITETAMIEDRDAAAAALTSLRAFGAGVALDDFGTGYSSLIYLTEMPFTKVKIDRSFIKNIDTDSRALGMVTNIARLSADLNLTVTIEGIETGAQLDAILRNTTAQHAQGYLFSVPLPAREIGELIRTTKPVRPVAANQRKKA